MNRMLGYVFLFIGIFLAVAGSYQLIRAVELGNILLDLSFSAVIILGIAVIFVCQKYVRH